MGIPVSLHSRPGVPGLLSPTTPYQPGAARSVCGHHTTEYHSLADGAVSSPGPGPGTVHYQWAETQLPDRRPPRVATEVASSNLQSAPAHPEAVNNFIRKELSLGHLLGPLPDTSHMPPLQINRIGVVPKGNNTGKWCLITDLSFSSGLTVNDGIDPSCAR